MADNAATNEPKPDDGNISSEESDWDNDDPDLIDDFKMFTANQPDYYTMHASGGMVTITPATSKTHIVAAPVEVEVDWAYGGHEVFVYTSFDDFQTAIPLEAKPDELTDEIHHVGTVLLPPGRYLIRYLVDGEWMVDDNQEVVCSLGNEYNSILVEDPNAEPDGSSDDEAAPGDDDWNELDDQLPDNFKSGSASDLFGGGHVDTSKGMVNISPDTFKDLESMTPEEKNKILMAGDVDAVGGKRASLVWDSHKRAFVIAKPELEAETETEHDDSKSETSSVTDDKRKEKEKARRKQKKKRQKEKRKKTQQRSAYGAAAARAQKAADIAAIKEEIVKREREWREAWILHELKTREDHEKEKEAMRVQWKEEREQWISKIKSYSAEAHQMRTINQELHHQLEDATRGVALQTSAVQREQEKFSEQQKLLEDELAAARKSASELRDQLTAARDESTALRNQLEDAKNSSRNESETLRSAESKSKLALEQVQRELTDSKAETKALEQQLQQTKAEYDSKIEGMKKDFELKNQQESSALTEATQNLEKLLNSRVQELNTAVDQKSAQLAEAREELKNVQKQLAEAKRESSTLQGELTSKIAELEQAKKDRSASGTQIAELNQKLDKLQAERKDAESAHGAKVSDLETQLNKLRASVLQKQAKMDDAVAELEKFKSDAALKEADHAREREEFKRQLERSAATTRGLRDKVDVVVKNASAIRTTMSGFKETNLKEIAALKSGLEDSKKFLINSLNMQSRLLDATMKKYKKELSERRKYFNMVQELKGNIRVFCRCRPMIDEDAKKGVGNAAQFPEENTIRIVSEKRDSEFEFDKVFGPDSTQLDVFAETKALVTSCMDGYNVCIFAYGQTGSGKTFTMEGTADNRGVNFRAITELFRVRDERSEDYNYKISVSMLEIYNESIRDLLTDKQAATGDESKSLKVHKGAQGMYVEGLSEWPVSSEEDVLKAIGVGSKNRSTGVTNMNEHSSRSHCLVSVKVEGQNLSAGITYVGKLHLIDLAGSERVSRSGATGDRLKEAQAINRSLSALGNVIEALQNKAAHVPYRNSKLTFLLQDSLGGHAKTLMFINVSPVLADAEETLCSLNFASRVMKVELGAAVRSAGAAAALAGAAPADEDKGDFVTDDGAPAEDAGDDAAPAAAAAAPKPAAAAAPKKPAAGGPVKPTVVKKPGVGARPAASTSKPPVKK